MAANPSASWNYQQSGTSSSYPSFGETLSNFQADSEELQNETFDGGVPAQQFQFGTSLLSQPTSEQPYYGNPALADSWRTNSQDGESDEARSEPNSTTVANDPQQSASSSNDSQLSARSKESGNGSGKPESTKTSTHPGQQKSDTYVPGVSRHRHSVSGDKVDPGTPAAPGDNASVPANDAANDLSTSTQDTSPKSSGGATEQDSAADSLAGSNVRGLSGNKNANTDLAFAVKVGANSAPANGDMSPSDNGPGQSPMPGGIQASSFINELKTVVASAGQGTNEDRNSGDGSTRMEGLAAAMSSPQGPLNSATKAEASISQEDVSKASEIIQDKAPDGQTLKAVQIRVTGDDNQQVDLRLIERSGALTVSVRSADSSLTRALQQNLPDLSTKLNDQQVRAEWWTPNTSRIEPGQKAENSSSNSGSGDSGQQNQEGQNKGNSGQQGGRGAPQPDWVEQLSDLRNSNQNGRQYSWHL